MATEEWPLHATVASGSLEQLRSMLLDPRSPAVDATDHHDWTPLHVAASQGKLAAVELLLHHGATVDAHTEYAATPALLAALSGHAEVLNRLADAGADMNAADSSGVSVLASASNVECLRVLLARDVKFVRSKAGRTALHEIAFAPRESRVEMASVLMDKASADLADAQDNEGRSVLHLACFARDANLAGFLLRCGCSTTIVDSLAATPLHIAADRGDTFTVQTLIDAGADVNACPRYTPLWAAARNGHDDVVNLLLLARADPSRYLPTLTGAPLYIAAQEGKASTVKVLLEADAEVDAPHPDDSTALLIASQEGHADVVDVLLRFGGNPSSVAASGLTPLLSALENGHIEVASMLCSSGSSLSATNKFGATPLFLAAFAGFDSVVAKCLGLGAEVDARNHNGCTPLFVASQNGHTNSVKTLLHLGADPSAAQKRGARPLHVASHCGHTAIVKVLVDAGADPRAVDEEGCSPLSLATAAGHADVVSILRA